MSIRKLPALPIFISIFALAGLSLLLITNAQSNRVVIEAESSSRTNGISRTDTTASNGRYIEFAEQTANTSGRGPTGQWPEGFPAYNTPADIVTDGTQTGLQSALNTLGPTGGVIEHPGNIERVNLDRPEGPEIVVRPPIGKRAEYTSSGNPRSSNLLLAGWLGTSTSISRDVNNSGGYRTIRNSGWAWIEGHKNSGMTVSGAYSDIEAFYYEIIFRDYADPTMGDRGGIRAAGNANTPPGRAIQTIVGSVLTGTVDAPPYHADTLQIYFDSYSSGNIYVRDSILWPSYDKMYQGGGGAVAEFDNVYVISPTMSKQVWNGPADISFFGQPYHTTGRARYTNSTLVGNSYPTVQIDVQNSEFYSAIQDSRINDLGGNTLLSELPLPPSVPTHEQLDQIWSP